MVRSLWKQVKPSTTSIREQKQISKREDTQTDTIKEVAHNFVFSIPMRCNKILQRVL